MKMLRSIIDPEKLIAEVKERPALYDSKTHGHDPNARKAQWEDISKEIFNDVWESSSASEKEALAKEVQVKWKSIRDAYNRVRKIEKEDQMKGILKPRKKYVFYDHLTFLDPVLNRQRPTSPTAVYIQEDRLDDNSGEVSYFSTDNSTFFKSDQEMFEATTSSRPDDTDTTTLTSILREVVKMQKEEKADDRMGNKKFLLSLLPFMEKLPDDVNLEVRLQLMSILQTYSSGESFMKV